MKRIWIFLLSMLLWAGTFTGCAVSSDNTSSGGTEKEAGENGKTDENAQDSTGDTKDSAQTAVSPDEMDLSFSARDLDVGYEESGAVKISLKKDQIEVDGDGASVKDSTVTITKEGTYILSGELSDGSVVVDAGDSDKIQLVLDNANIHCESFAPVFISQADKVFLTLAEGSKNTVSDGASYTLTEDTENVDAAIFSRADLTINGTGSLTVEGNCEHAVVSKDDLVITGGTSTIASKGQGLTGKDCLKIADGTFSIETEGDSLKSSNSEESDRGFVYIRDGSFSIASGDDAIKAETALIIQGGSVNITQCNEGLEAAQLYLKGGDIQIIAGDDGINASSGSKSSTEKTLSGDVNNDMNGRGNMGHGMGMDAADESCQIYISGGSLDITAGGDGIDSNGSLTVSGGEIYVNGPENDGNASLDYAGTAQITGGTFLAAGSAGMALGFSDSSSQCSVLQVLDNSYTSSDAITVTDEAGTVLLSYTPKTAYRCVVFSAPGLQTGSTYTLQTGKDTNSLTLSSTVTQNGNVGQMGGMGGRGGMRRGNMDGRGNMTSPSGAPDDMTPPSGAPNDNTPDGDGAAGSAPREMTGGQGQSV